MNAPWDCKSHSRAVVGASVPGSRSPAPAGAPKGFPLALWKPSGPEGWRDFLLGLHPHHPRRSRRVMLPDRKLLPAELSCNAACRGLSARPLHPFGSSSENNAYGTASPTPAPESARQAPPKNIPAPECPHKKAEAAHSAPLPLSHLFQGIKLPAPVDLPGEPLRHRPGDKVRRAAHRLIFAKRVRHGVDK